MRTPADMPRARRRRSSRRGRTVLIVVAVALFLLITSLRGIAGFYTDYLWFDSLDLTSVWTGVLGAKLALGLIFTGIFFVLMWVNLVIADRLAPRFRPAGPEEELIERYHELVGRRAGLVRIGVALLFALIAGAGVSSQWNEWILFTNRVDFDRVDPLFDTDIGFYVFQLPFLTFVASWAFAAFLIILIVTAVAHYLNGGIRVQTPLQRVTPQVKAHLSVLLGVLALVKAGGYWLQRYELALSTRGVVDGASFTDVNAQLPAINLLLLISLFAAVLFLFNIRRRGWVLPVLAVGLWAFVAVVAGGIVPAFIQRFQVEPAESTKEAQFIERNISATREAMGLSEVQRNDFDYSEDLGVGDLEANAETIRNVRLLDPNVVQDTYQRLQGARTFYRFTDLDIDRYQIDNEITGESEITQVVLSTRELNPEGIPQKSWEGQHLAFTHGYGAALAAANATTEEGRPDFLVRGVPVDTEIDLDITRPEVYFGEDLGGYSIVGTDRNEESGTGEPTSYEGEGGVDMGSYLRRAAFALRFGDINPLISNFITSDSRILYVRDIQERVEAVAPFLHFDADPYPVVVDGGIVYVVDAYTTSDRYPYAQRADNDQLPAGSGLDHNFNYVRNSVKAVIDTYDGTVELYLMPDGDPIARAYANAFPDLFSEFDEMPEELTRHLRFPEDLFRVQTNMWTRYHIDEAPAFYEQTDGWNVAQDPGVSVGGPAATQTTNAQGELSATEEKRIDPYYQLMRLPGEEEEQFLILRPFVPVSENDERKELRAFMTARYDPSGGVELRTFEMPGNDIDGPAIVASNILSEQSIARELTLLNDQGSRVVLGNLLLIPIEQSLLYVRPMYVQASGTTAVPELKNVILAYGDRVVMENTLEEALAEIFGGAPETLEAQPADPEDEVTPSPDGQPPPEASPDTPDTDTDGEPDADATMEQLLADAAVLFDEADAALAEGNLGEYQAKVEDARQLIERALELQGGGATTTTSPATPA